MQNKNPRIKEEKKEPLFLSERIEKAVFSGGDPCEFCAFIRFAADDSASLVKDTFNSLQNFESDLIFRTVGLGDYPILLGRETDRQKSVVGV